MTDGGLVDDLCLSCGGSPITDSSTGELLCGSCGIVLRERLETLSPEWRNFSSMDEDRARVGYPSSLLIHDTGLSTFIGNLKSPAGAGRRQSPDHDTRDELQLDGAEDESSHSIEGSSGRTTRGQSGRRRENPQPGLSAGSERTNEIGSLNRSFHPIPVSRLRKLNAMSVASAPVSRNLKKATWEINRVCSTLGLSWQVAERAAYFYRKSLQKNLIKGRSITGFVYASIYLACKERRIPRTVDEICREIGLDKPFGNHCYKILVKEMQLDPPMSDPYRSVTKISAKAGIEERVTRKARDILSKIANHTAVMGKNPLVLAAAALYLATVECGLKNITKTTIADAAEVSTISLRKRLADITVALNSIKAKQTALKHPEAATR
jgi:transcription initiation factor TFIIIB Brf1 subunit/transcription initiation factor TFIIB